MSLIQSTNGICDACGNETELVGNRCYVCHRLRQKQRNVRIGGTILMILGLIVVGMMIPVIYCASQPVIKNGYKVLRPGTDTALTILYFVLAYGISFLFAGLWHAVTGKVNKVLLYAASGMGIVIFIAARLVVIAK